MLFYLCLQKWIVSIWDKWRWAQQRSNWLNWVLSSSATEQTFQSWFVDSAQPWLTNRARLLFSRNLKYIPGWFRKYLSRNIRTALTFSSRSSHVILIAYFNQLPLRAKCIGPPAAQLVCFEPGSRCRCVPGAFSLLISENGRKIVLEKQFLRRHNNSRPHFSHPLTKERGKCDCFPCTAFPEILRPNLFHFPPAQDGYMRKSVTALYTSAWTCL